MSEGPTGYVSIVRAWTRVPQRGVLLSWGGLLGLAFLLVLVFGPFRGQARGQQAPSELAIDSYQANCAFCHGVNGDGTFRGPSLVGVGEASADYYLRSGRMPVKEPGPAPPRQEPALPPEEIEALIAYVGGFGQGPPIPQVNLGEGEIDISRGQNLYQLNCAACHNWDGKGGAMVSSQYPIAYPLRPVPPVQLAEAIRIGPGTMPVFPPDVLTDEEVDDIVAYVEYLKHPINAGGYGLAHWGPATEGLAATVGLGLILLVTMWLGQRTRASEETE
jgi:ubiquinol-cytochrome c reductase cytochrome c subunit